MNKNTQKILLIGGGVILAYYLLKPKSPVPTTTGTNTVKPLASGNSVSQSSSLTSLIQSVSKIFTPTPTVTSFTPATSVSQPTQQPFTLDYSSIQLPPSPALDLNPSSPLDLQSSFTPTDPLELDF